MNGISAGGNLFDIKYPFEAEKRNDDSVERQRWQDFLVKYNNFSEKELLSFVRRVINKVTELSYTLTSSDGLNLQNRRKYILVQSKLQKEETGLEFLSNEERNIWNTLKRYVYRDREVNLLLESMLSEDATRQKQLLEDAMLLAMNTRMKVFLFRHVDTEK